RLGIGPQRADFWFTMGSGERGKRSVSAERVKNGAGDNGFRWDTSVEAFEFPIRIRQLWLN
ncbi:MAG: hypothetical protein D4R63_12405, partial [Methylococcaceae bacterium]